MEMQTQPYLLMGNCEKAAHEENIDKMGLDRLVCDRSRLFYIAYIALSKPRGI
jgi:hypothetical protein